MSVRFKPFPDLKDEQAQASDPAAHASLSASAGTGKTQVLTARVLRLLLQGARPESIVCLTFTKAAAAEMANRIGARLARWVRIKDSELGTDLLHLGESNDPRTRERARQLFAKVLDCPGGLKIQTIHSFAQTLLAAFPAEAGITPGFKPIEGRAEQELVRRTLADLMADAEARSDEALIGDVQCLSRRLGEAGAIEYLQACARKPEPLDKLGSREGIEAQIQRLMDLPGESVDDYIAHHCGDDRFDCELLQAVADANRKWGAQTGHAHADVIEEWLALTPIERAAELSRLRKVVLTEKGTPRVSVGQTKAEPHYESHAGRLADLIEGLLRIQNGARLARDIAAGLRAGQAFAKAYTQAKRAAGVADFNDLIEWTRRLLKQPGMGDWVRYKLDRQVDHVLVDEAQDTNAAQWEIIEHARRRVLQRVKRKRRAQPHLVHGWRLQAGHLRFPGVGSAQVPGRQGSVQAARGRRQHRRRPLFLSAAGKRIPRPLDRRELSLCAAYTRRRRRCDRVVGPEALALSEPPPPHRAHHLDRPGSVELWQPFAVEESPDDSDEGEERWVALRDRRYADVLAERIKLMVEEAPDACLDWAPAFAWRHPRARPQPRRTRFA